MKTKQYALIFVVLAAALLFCPAVRGQTYFGSILGTITDSSGGVVPGATITLTNLGTNEKHSKPTDPAGFYEFLNLVPGSYRIEADQKGFKHLIRGPVVLEVNGAVRIDVTMEVGALGQTIEVTAATPLLEPVTSSIGEVVAERKVEELPLNGRNPLSLVALVPGVVPQGFSQSNPAVVNFSAWGNFQIGGAMANESEAIWDGITLGTVSANGISFVPSEDALQEFKVQTNNLSAEFGRTAGGIINLTTKSGANEYHGSAYEFLRNKVLDANNFFNNAGGIAVGPFTQNQFGATFGGPFVIPHVYDGHDKTFFFVNYEGFRQRVGQTFLYTVPTMAQRIGDFSQSYDAHGNLVPIYDPLTTVPDPANPGHFLRNQFECNSVLNVICPGRIDPVAKIMGGNTWPAPNSPGAPFTSIDNFLVDASNPTDEDQFTSRVDKVVSDKQRITARYAFYYIDAPGVDPFHNKTTTTDNGAPTTNKASNVAFDYISSFSPTSVFDLRIGYARLSFVRTPASIGQDLTQLGFPSSFNDEVQVRMIPIISPEGVTPTDNDVVIIRHEDTAQIQANLTKILNRHTLKWGFDGRMYRDSDMQSNSPSGGFSFTNQFTAADPFTLVGGLGMASFMLGYPSSASVTDCNFVALQSLYRAFYFQDDFRATSRLTFNLGLRWDWPGDFTERHNNLSFFLPDAVSPLAQPTGLPLVGRLGVVASPDRSSRAAVNTYLRGWGPRFGFAYRLGSNTVIRGGYALFQLPNNLDVPGIDDSVNLSSTTFISSLNGGETPFNVLSNPFPTGLISPPGHDGPFQQTFEGQSPALYTNTNYPGYAQQWNLNVQRQLPSDMLLDVAYAGSKGVKIPLELLDTNQVPDQYLSMGSALYNLVQNPFYGLIPSGGFLAQPTVAQEQLLRPYPQYAAPLFEYWPNAGKSIYHSLQIKVEKKFSKGSTFLASYTVAKLISDTDSVTEWLESSGVGWDAQDTYNRRAERSLSTYDVPQRFVLSYVLDLPVGRGKKFLANVTGVPGKLVSGWSVNGITTLQSGFPLQLYALTATRPNNICKGSASRSGPATSRLNEWFNTSCYVQPAPFTYGNAGRTSPNVRTPGINNFDFSLFKNTYFGPEDKLAIQFRAEFFNIFNRVQFGYPGQTLGTPSFGVISSQTNDPRLIQFALKLIF
jgi:hypothetical protein